MITDTNAIAAVTKQALDPSTSEAILRAQLVGMCELAETDENIIAAYKRYVASQKKVIAELEERLEAANLLLSTTP